MFRREPKLLIDIIEHKIELSPLFRDTLLRALFSVEQFEDHSERFNLILKYGQKISKHRWEREVAPAWDNEVCIKFNLFLMIIFIL